MKLRFKKLEDEIAKEENNLLALQEKLCLEEVYSNPVESEKISKEIKTLEDKISSLYEEWEAQMNN